MGRGGGEGEVISDILIDNDIKWSSFQVTERSMDNQVCARATPIQDMNIVTSCCLHLQISALPKYIYCTRDILPHLTPLVVLRIATSRVLDGLIYSSVKDHV